jgi:hypothetical protein
MKEMLRLVARSRFGEDFPYSRPSETWGIENDAAGGARYQRRGMDNSLTSIVSADFFLIPSDSRRSKKEKSVTGSTIWENPSKDGNQSWQSAMGESAAERNRRPVYFQWLEKRNPSSPRPII